jgi:hypothetical protein
MVRWWEHDWKEVDMQKTYGNVCLIMDDERVCTKCGFKQSYTADYAWMRVIGKSWYPKTGRKCPKGVKDEKNR